ncbi:MAG: cytochrome P450 [Novosphingobium sp.]|nr:cytochrome P450 [Novosphingobium sp.]
MNAESGKLLSEDPFSPQVMVNPLPFYKALRDHQPVKYYPEFDTFFLSRFEDVWDALRVGDNTFLSTENSLPTPEYLRSHHNSAAPPFASTDPLAPGPTLPSPWYENMRQAHIAPLRPKAVRALGEFVSATVEERLDDVLAKGTFDLIGDFAGLVNATVVCHLFGIDTAKARELLALGAEITRIDPQQGGVDFNRFFERLMDEIIPAIRARRAAGADGGNALIDGLVNFRMPDGRALSDEEISNQLSCVMLAGMESASKVTATGLMELYTRPDQLAQVQADIDTNVPIAVNEMVRFTAPAQYTFRTAHKDTSVGGQQIRAGQRIACLLRSASRDEREFDRPNDFIWNRDIKRVISFGLGQHHCIGKHLALLEVKTMTAAFLRRAPSIEFLLDEGERNPSCFQWGWIRMPVRVTAQ